MNQRSLIRNIVAARIVALQLDLNVFKSRKFALQELELPAVIVSIDNEQSEVSSQSGKELKKSAQLSIEILIDAEESKLDEKLDQITAQIEEVILSDESLNDSVDHCILKSTDTALVREGEIDLGLARMNYEVTYYSSLNQQAQNETPFQGVSIHFSLKDQFHGNT